MHDAVASNHRLRVVTARRREAASDAGRVGDRRERALISVNARDGDALRVERDDTRDRDPDRARNDSRTR
jgi:hypothetical protein